MKKRIIGILACLTVATSLGAICACATDGGGNKNPGGDNPPHGGGEETKDNFKITLEGNSSRTLDIGEESELKWTVTNNGSTVTDVQSEVLIVGDAVTYNAETGKVSGVKAGSATVTISLKDKEDVRAVEVKFTVYEYFFSHELKRGEVNFTNENAQTNPRVSLNGGQSCVVAKRQDTKWVFRCKVTNFDRNDYNETFAIASVSDIQSKQLWFGPKGVKPTQGIFDIYVRNWYNGWSDNVHEFTADGYSSVEVGKQVSGGREVEFELVRDGADYYYNVGGYWGKYHDRNNLADVPTYPGIYSQNRVLQVSDFTVSYEQDDVTAAADAYATKTAAAVAIAENKLMLVKGGSFQYTAKTYPESAQGGEIVWSLETGSMTAGVEGTTVENGLLQLSNEAAGVVTIVAGIKDTEIRTRRDIIIIDNAEQSNDILTAKGGVQLDADTGAITFLDIFKDIDGVGSEEGYQVTDYCAVLKQNVKNDFTLEFKVSDYQTTAQFPKLQIGLGSFMNNLYLACYPNGTYRFEARMRAMVDGAFRDGWYNSEALEDFNPAGTNSFKIQLTAGGVYKVFANGKELAFTFDNSKPVVLMRDFPSFESSLPVKIATKGVSATVSDITVTDGNPDLQYEKYWYYNGTNVTVDEEKDGDPITLKLANNGWTNKDHYLNRVLITDVLPENYAVEYDVKFSNRTTDTKLSLMMGDWQLFIVNKLNSNATFSGQLLKGNDWNNAHEVKAIAEVPTYAHVRLERNNNSIRYIVNDVIIAEASGAPAIRHLEFYGFNETPADETRTVEIKNITVSEYSKKDIYGIEIETNTTITDFAEAAATPINVSVKLNGAPVSEPKLAYELDDPAAATLDTTGAVATIKGLKEGEVILTVKVLDGENNVLISKQVTYTVEHVLVENNYVSVKGGVKLQINGADPQDVATEDYTLIFPEDKGNVDGVGNQQAYEDNAYSAQLKQKVKGDFSIEFTVSDYVAVTNGPKLMLSLGGTHNQFFLCYYPDTGAAFGRDGIARIETYVDTCTSDNKFETNGNWGESANFAGDTTTFPGFDKTAAQTFKIAVINRMYHMYLKVGGEFKELVHYSRGGEYTFARRYEDYVSELPIRISTNGAAAKVSGIKITSEGFKDNYYMPHTDNVHIYDPATDGAEAFDFRITATNSSWEGRDNYINKVGRLTDISANTQVEMTAKFSGAMQDGKLIISVGEKQAMLCSKTGGGFFVNINGCGADWNEGAHPVSGITAAADGSYTMNVKIVRADGNIAVYVNDTKIHELGNAGNAGGLWFAIFNGNSDDAAKTVTVSNLTVTNS